MGHESSRTNRRRFLKGLGALSVVGLAGCGGDGDGDTPTDTPTDTDPVDTTQPVDTTEPPGTDPVEMTPTQTRTATPPSVENPPPSVTPAGTIGGAPEGATILFGGDVDDLSKWESTGGGDAPWPVADDGSYFEIDIGSGSIQTTEGFGDCHLHIEFSPDASDGSGQSQGNSGVFMLGRYEFQVLNNYENETYNDGLAGSYYGQSPPLVDPSTPPEEFQVYDVIWRGPTFEDGEVVDPARACLFFNGVLVQAHLNIGGPSTASQPGSYSPHAEELPLVLQDHGDSANRYRNVWYRDLPPEEEVRSNTEETYLPSYDDGYQSVYGGDRVYVLEPRGGRYADSGDVEKVQPGDAWGDPPSHATVLLGEDGSLDGWEAAGSGSPGWREESGYVAVEPGAGNIQSTETFADGRLHAEFRIPEDVSGVGANRGNSGLLLANRYELQILDNHDNQSQPDQWVGAYTGQAPPLASPTRPPGEWQSFDVLWEGPRFANAGNVLERPGRLTALLNGVVVQKRLYLNGANTGDGISYGDHPPAQPLGLQDGGDPVHFRNVWYTTVA